MELAKEWLRKHGVKTANLKSSRDASEGLVGIKVNNNIGYAIEVILLF
jgi:translation elongation factor EF-Ts